MQKHMRFILDVMKSSRLFKACRLTALGEIGRETQVVRNRTDFWVCCNTVLVSSCSAPPGKLAKALLYFKSGVAQAEAAIQRISTHHVLRKTGPGTNQLLMAPRALYSTQDMENKHVYPIVHVLNQLSWPAQSMQQLFYSFYDVKNKNMSPTHSLNMLV